MGLSRDKWKAEFRAGDSLPWQCPDCRVSPIRVVADSLKTGQTRASRVAQGHAASEPEWVDGRFSCIMDCAHCGNTVGVAGSYRVVDDRHVDEEHGESGDYAHYFRPKFFTESPHVFEIPAATPDSVTEELVASFQLFWSDPLACTSRIRSSVERLLTAQKVPQTTGKIAAKARRQFLALHHRIERFATKRPEIAEKLMAVKWIGNAGSHSRGATIDDALDGYELMDWVLDRLYATRHHRASSLTREINRRKAPRSSSRRSG